ncbi:response regulator [Rhodoplanes serenus]|uniref:Response regulator n=1 Tax=Rhodoplanes serenus TaxID=200615 RepID=A0A327JY29_9BRAD|nr:response regulator [Rhodoplanes serenus]MBI5111463.1 response regulator [Rhodovulum sp.]MTW16824.1 response regulator [Rhodoplanes serenus]RAI31067.1 response regulator [Rhodoplanes serenus]VCU10515.1 Response regulator receiver protein CpdR [Rhodoplanes serenus]
MARILIAEDEETLRTLIVRGLSQDGHTVVAAADGAEALDVLVQQQGRFDLLLTDIRMPLMDGIALALAVARDYPDVIILLMTAYADQRERAHGLEALIHDVISKPFTLAELRVAVDEALAAGGKEAASDRP